MLLVLLFLEDRSIFHTVAVCIVTVFRFYYILYIYFFFYGHCINHCGLYIYIYIILKSKQNKNRSIHENKTTVYSLTSSVLYYIGTSKSRRIYCIVYATIRRPRWRCDNMSTYTHIINIIVSGIHSSRVLGPPPEMYAKK